MSKKFGVSTEIKYIDLAEILANYKNPKFWKKSWCVFKTKDFECYWKMTYINIGDNSISSQVELHYHGKHNCREYSWSSGIFVSSCSSIPIENSDYTQEVFNRNITNAIAYTIEYLEKAIVIHSYDYQQAIQLERDEEERLTEVAEDFLDQNNVSNKDIREAYIDRFVSDASKYDYTGRIKASAIRKYYPSARLMLYSWFNNKKKFDEEAKFLKENMGVTKKLTYEIWKARKELESDAFIEEAESKLEGI